MNADAHRFRHPGEAVALDISRLSAYLASVGLPLDPAVLPRQFATGLANRNYLIQAGGRPLVLRRPPDGELPPGAHDMAREHRILSRLWRELPLAPEGVHLCANPGVIGAPFQLIAYRPGLVIKGDEAANFAGRPDVARRCGLMLVETLAAVHRVDCDKVGLGDLGKPEGFRARAIRGWVGRAERVARDDRTLSRSRKVGAWLAAAEIKPSAPVLLHSDFKLDNLILEPATLAPVAIVDWDMGTRGDPLFDLATMLSYWTEPGDPEVFKALRQMPTATEGFSTREEIVDTYGRLTGREVSDYRVWRVLALLKLAVVLLQLDALWRRGAAAGAAYEGFEAIGIGLLEHALTVADGQAS